jgi:pyridoxine kinase
MNVLSIQSGVVYGHVGNSAAQFCLQRMGHEAWRIDTVRFSNHPGHGGFAGEVTAAAEIGGLVAALDARGWLAGCDALLSGYLGAADQGEALLGAAARLRAANPRALWLLDPVIGDDGRVFVKPGIPEFMRDAAVPAADIVTPNAFELSWLSGMPVHDVASAAAAQKGVETLSAQSAAFTKKAWEDGVAAAQSMSQARSIQELLELQTTWAKSATEAYLAEVTKATDVLTASVKNSFKPINERVTASVEKFQAAR